MNAFYYIESGVKQLIENYKRIEIKKHQLYDVDLLNNKPYVLAIEWDGVLYEFLIKLKESSSNMILLGSGAGAKQEHPQGPPYFQRHSWMDLFDASVIYYNDPTLYLGPLSLGWGQGTKERFYLQEISVLLKEILEKLHIPLLKVTCYGSSGGGFMSLILAGYLKGAKAVVNNPQTCLTKWLKTPVRNVFSLSYPDMSQEEVVQTFHERINVLAFYQKIGYVPPIDYLQNAASEFDMLNHLIPFLSGLHALSDDCEVHEIKVILNYNKKQGHAALGKQETVDYLSQKK